MLNVKDFFHFGSNVNIFGEIGILNPDKIYIGDSVCISRYVELCVSEIHNRENRINIKINDRCYMNAYVKIECLNYIELGKYIAIGPHAYISDIAHRYVDYNVPINLQGFDNSFSNKIVIKDGVWIGANSSIIGNVTIGYGTIVAANSVVNREIPDHVLVAGAPAKIIKICDYRTGQWVNVKNNPELLNEILSKRGEFQGYDYVAIEKRSNVLAVDNEKCKKILELIDTIFECINYVEKQLKQGNLDKTKNIMSDIIEGINKVQTEVVIKYDNNIIIELSKNLNNSLQYLLEIYKSNNSTSILNELQVNLIPTFNNWKNELNKYLN